MLTETILLYYFSASFQGLAALLGLLGVFAIFRLQQLGARADSARALLFSDNGKSTWGNQVLEYQRMSCEQKREEISKVEKRDSGSLARLTLLPLMVTWVEADEQAIQLRNSMWKPILGLAIVMLLSLWIIPFSGHISKLTCWLAWLVVIMNLLASTCAVIWNLFATYAIIKAAAR